MSGWEYVTNGGDSIPVTLEGVMEGGVVIPLEQVPEVVGGDTGPDPVSDARPLGGYNGPHSATLDADLAFKNAFGAWSGIASSYYQPNQQGLSITRETTRINRGISPLINLTTRGTQRLIGIAGNANSATNAADRAWLDEYLDALHQLSLVDRNVKVRATLDQEFEVRVQQGTMTGPAASFVNYGQALSYMFARAAERCPYVEMIFWVGGASSQRANILTIWRNITVPFHGYSVDPYAQGGSSPASTWRYRLDDARTGVYAAEWNRLGQPYMAISETGINKAAVTDAQAAAWISNLPESIVAAEVEWCVYFNRDSGENGEWRIDGGTYQPRPLSVAAMSAALVEANGP